jgi:hypothetical protein
MTQQEFTQRTNVQVSNTEFDAIHEVYMNSDLDKDEFCKMWCKMNRSRVERAKEDSRMSQKISDLYAIKAKILLYDYSWNELADNFLTKKEKDLLSEFGIEMQGMNSYPYFKTCSTVFSELTKILA